MQGRPSFVIPCPSCKSSCTNPLQWLPRWLHGSKLCWCRVQKRSFFLWLPYRFRITRLLNHGAAALAPKRALSSFSLTVTVKGSARARARRAALFTLVFRLLRDKKKHIRHVTISDRRHGDHGPPEAVGNGLEVGVRRAGLRKINCT